MLLSYLVWLAHMQIRNQQEYEILQGCKIMETHITRDYCFIIQDWLVSFKGFVNTQKS